MNIIKLSNFGRNLGSRILARQIIQDLNESILNDRDVVLDFDGIRYMSFSFATETIDFLEINECNISIVNAKELIGLQLSFAQANLMSNK
jgi:hypothetical protein